MYSVKSSGIGTLSCNAGSTRLPPECPWIALKYRKCLEELGFKAVLKLCLWSSSFCQKDLRSVIDCCEVPSNFALNSLIKWSNRTVPSHSRGIDGWCRGNLIMALDTVKHSGQISGLMSIHVRSRLGIEVGDNVKVGFGRGLAFATSFPVTLCSTF